MKTLLAKLKALIAVVYNRLGDPRSKNAMIFILMMMTAFGIVAPDTATALRDFVLKMAL